MRKNLKKLLRFIYFNDIPNNQILNVVFMQQYYKLSLTPNQEI